MILNKRVPIIAIMRSGIFDNETTTIETYVDKIMIGPAASVSVCMKSGEIYRCKKR